MITSQPANSAGLFYVFALVTAVVAIFSAVLMTEPGQSLNLPRSWVVTYYANRWLMIGVTLALLVILWGLHLRVRRWRNVWMYLASLGVVFCLVAANFPAADVFPIVPIWSQLRFRRGGGCDLEGRGHHLCGRD